MNGLLPCIKVRVISPGKAEGETLVSKQPINFLKSVNPKTGIVEEKNHDLAGQCLKNKIIIFPHGTGSTVGSYVIYGLKKYGVAPLAMVNEETDVVVAAGCIFAGIPCVDGVNINQFKSGLRILVDADNGFIVPSVLK
jgi:predicted aconitase with swiveling domain